MEKEITCAVCETEFTIIHEEEDTPEYCPFCGNSLEEDLVDLEEEWDENPNPYGDSED
jgi:transcription initiation factor TFIIIB Brf1 subunit/transcription initiation factor TFIIB